MSKKNKQAKTGGREHAIAMAAKTPAKSRKGAAAEEPMVEAIIDAEGIHVLPQEGQEPTEMAGAGKARKKVVGDLELCTFAFRLTKAESAAIHKAAGPGKASSFARTILLAAAAKDMTALETILEGTGQASAVTDAA